MAQVGAQYPPRPKDDDVVECWLCRGKGETSQRRYHNQKTWETCRACNGAGHMTYEEVAEAHKKYYVAGQREKLTKSELEQIKNG